MPKKKRITFVSILWEIVVKPAWYWLVTIIPTALAIYQFFGGDRNTIANISSKTWLMISLIAFILTILISTYMFRKAHLLQQEKIKSGRNRNKKVVSTTSRAKDDGKSIAISGNNYAPINQGNYIESQHHQETSPNIVVNKFGSEVLTLKLINKIDGQTVQVGTGETLERFYIEFVNKKKPGVKTEDAIKVYVNISFYTIDCRLIKSHDKPRWWVKYDPFDENTWDAEINLEASEKPMQLFLVLRKANGTSFYINSRRSHESPDWIIPDLELKEQSNYIHIRLSAKNLDAQDYWVLMESKGDKEPLFKLLAESPCNSQN